MTFTDVPWLLGADDVESPAMQLNDRLGEGQSEAGSGDRAAVLLPHLHEGLKRRLDVVGEFMPMPASTTAI